MNKKYILWASVVILLLLVAYIIYNRANKKKQFALLYKQITDVSTTGGDYTDLKNSDAFNPNYYKGKALPPLWDSTNNIIEKIHDGDGVFYDDEQSIVDLFRRFTTKSQVSYIAEKFQGKYGTALITYLEGFMVNAGNPLQKNFMIDIDNIVKGLK